MNVFELFGTIAINNNQALDAIGKTVKHANDAAKKIGSITLKMGKAVIGAGTAVAGAWMGAVESTRDYRTAMAKLDTAFVTNGFSAETALKMYKDLQAVLGETDQAVEAANHLAVMCEKEEDLAKWADICTGIYATFGDSLPIEGLTESANETAKVGQVTGTLADALNWAGISEDDFNTRLRACTSDQERQNLIMNTLYATYKNASDQYKETGESVMQANRAQENLNGALAKLGEIGEPIMTGFKNWVANMVNAAVPHLENFIEKFGSIETVWNEKVWPLLQQGFEFTFGIKLPDWDTFKTNLKTDWEKAKTTIAEFLKLEPEAGKPDTGGFITKIQEWWTGQGDNAYERLKSILTWTLGEFIAPALDAVDAWWTGEGGGLDKILGFLGWTLGELALPALADLVSTAGQSVADWAAEFIKGVVDLLDWTLGELGLPTVSDTVDKIKAWWEDVKKELKLKIEMALGIPDLSKVLERNPNLQQGAGAVDVTVELAEGSEDAMQSEIDSMTLNGTMTIYPDMSPVYQATEGYYGEYGHGWNTGYDTGIDSSSAVGMDRVPRDGWVARVHKDEAILDKTDAEVWRGGNFSRIEALLTQLVANTAVGQQVVLDSGILVGQLAPQMDARLGTISGRKGRGN